MFYGMTVLEEFTKHRKTLCLHVWRSSFKNKLFYNKYEYTEGDKSELIYIFLSLCYKKKQRISEYGPRMSI